VRPRFDKFPVYRILSCYQLTDARLVSPLSVRYALTKQAITELDDSDVTQAAETTPYPKVPPGVMQPEEPVEHGCVGTVLTENSLRACV